jgi:hypothetical protein
MTLSHLEGRHRRRARVEYRIRAKDSGLRNLPFGEFANNACWVELSCVAQDLIAFTQGLVLEGELAKAEPNRLLHLIGKTPAGQQHLTPHNARPPARIALGQGIGRRVRHTSVAPAHYRRQGSPKAKVSSPQRFLTPPRRSTGSFLDAYKASTGRVG